MYSFVIMTFLRFYVQRRQIVIMQERIEWWWVRTNFFVYVSGMQERLQENKRESIMGNIPKQSKKVCCDKRVSCNMQERPSDRTDTLRFGARFPSVGSRCLRPRLASFDFDAVDGAVKKMSHLLLC